MLHAAVHGRCIGNDLMAWTPFNVTNKTDAAAVFFVGGVIQASFFGQVTVEGYAHKYALNAVVSRRLGAGYASKEA